MKSRKHYRQLAMETQNEVNEFLRNFNPSAFSDFSTLDFRLGRYSHIAPFPSKNIADGWRYEVFLTRSDVEDIATIAHELIEWTIGRLIERLLNLEAPLFLQRKQEDKFWMHGKKQKYVLEHVLTTLGEAADVTNSKLMERIAKEDVKVWFET